MQAPHGYWRRIVGVRLAKQLALALLVLAPALGSISAIGTIQAPRRPSQGQVSGQFLRDVLRADYAAAFRLLAPEVRQTVSQAHFEAAARPLWKSGQQRGHEIELYKLGLRMTEHGPSRLFYTFSFAADSNLKPPPVLLEVTFRDTAARVILSFGLQAAKAPVKLNKPIGKPKQ